MKRITTPLLLIIMASTLLITGCGAEGVTTDGKTPASSPTTTTTTTQPTKAIVKLTTQGALTGGAQIGGIDVTITLPAGVTVKSAANPPETDLGVIAASGVAAADSTLITNYTPATEAAAGTVRVLLVNANGFNTGEFLTAACDIATGSTPTASDVLVDNLSIRDLNGASLTGFTVELSEALE